jgi:anti-sigma regulatory factor (Ser/Thr protein kinase)
LSQAKETEIKIRAVTENLHEVLGRIDALLEETECPMKIKMQIDLSVEEIFINIASYAYGEDSGDVSIRASISRDPDEITITFTDSGVKYDPLSAEDPDVTLSAQERQIGGLGIFLTKKSMDVLAYEYIEGKNILTMKKKLST